VNRDHRARPGLTLGRMMHRLVTAATVAAVGVGTLGSLPASAAVQPRTSVPSWRGAAGPPGSYVVRAIPGRLNELTAALTDRGLTPGRRIAIIDAVVVDLPPGAADSLRADPSVASVTTNAPVTLNAAAYDPATDVNSLYGVTDLIGSRKWWSKTTGAGVDVALIDSGVTPVVGLSDPGKIVNGPDLTPESQSTGTRYLDTYGHGTHMAGIIAGHDPGVNTATAQNNTADFLGVAPEARVVSVKVADAHGFSDVSQVIAGIDWVVQHARDPGLNIRVMNLSFGTNSTQAYTVDPLAYAVEVAWRRGIVVVTSAGNSGATDGRLTTPASDPFVIAVGADDLRGSKTQNDDVIPIFSSRGNGTRNPDLVAPGVHIQSLRVPGSAIDTRYASTGAIDGRFFRGSGTSQAAAFVSGCVALMLQKSPGLTPDQVKTMITSTAGPLPAADPQGQGAGLISMRRVAGASPGPVTAQLWTPSTGLGSLEAARGDAHLTMGGVTLSGEKDLNGKPFNAAAMAAAAANGSSWAGGTWNGSTWAGSSWAGSSWAGSSWAGSSWAGSSWAGSSWAGSFWAGSSWAGSFWAGSSWAGSSWAGSSWAGSSWAGSSWAGSSWAGRSWADDAWS
jgi:serine protease AprX